MEKILEFFTIYKIFNQESPFMQILRWAVFLFAISFVVPIFGDFKNPGWIPSRQRERDPKQDPLYKEIHKPPVSEPQEIDSKPPPYPFALTLRHIEGPGIGYEYGYTSLTGLVFLKKENVCWPFIDMRFHLFNNVKIAANGGLGVRFSSTRMKSLVGINVYYDYRQAYFNFHQIGAGIEWLSESVDLRMNGYIPLTNHKHISTCHFTDYLGGYFIIQRRLEAAFWGIDMEVGGLLFNNADVVNLYGAIGPYYLNDLDCQDGYGGKLRFKLGLTRFFSIDASASYDEVFRWRGQGQLSLNFVFGGPAEKPIRNIVSQPVVRREIIAIDRFCKWQTNY